LLLYSGKILQKSSANHRVFTGLQYQQIFPCISDHGLMDLCTVEGFDPLRKQASLVHTKDSPAGNKGRQEAKGIIRKRTQHT
jgi:hypothetical protein